MSIPLSTIVTINPGVLDVGNDGNDLFGLMLTQKNTIPALQLTSVTNADDVGKRFGYDSTEYQLASVYFAGFTDSDRVAAQLYMAPYSQTATSAILIGGSLASVSLKQLRTFTSDVKITIDKTEKSLSNLDLSAVTSFSQAAQLLGEGLGCTVVYSASTNGFIISSPTTGDASDISAATGTLADLLALSLARGALISPSVTQSSLTDLLNKLRKQSLAFCSVFLGWEGSKDEKLELAEWANTMRDDVCVILSDSDGSAIVAGTGLSFAEQVQAQGYESVCCVYNHLDLCAFIAGYAAAWDLNKSDGRFTAAFRRSTLLTPVVTDQDVAAALEQNGYNFYGIWASATSMFEFMAEGQISGQFKWLDSWYCQAWMRRMFQLYFVRTLLAKGQIPYNTDGKSILNTAIKPAITRFIRFGAIRSGISLSDTQTQSLKQAGLNQSQINSITSTGYYLNIDMESVTPQERVKRQSPPISFWYTDGQSVQTITMNSIEIQ